jgi:hypothetical protein
MGIALPGHTADQLNAQKAAGAVRRGSPNGDRQLAYPGRGRHLRSAASSRVRNGRATGKAREEPATGSTLAAAATTKADTQASIEFGVAACLAGANYLLASKGNTAIENRWR